MSVGNGLPPYTVRRSSRAKRARLTVTAEGQAVVVLPQRAPAGSAQVLVERHEAWLRRHLERAASRRDGLELRPPLENGRVLTVNGIPHRVRLVTDAAIARGSTRQSLDLDQGGIVGVLEVRHSPEMPPVPILERWFRDQARSVLRERVGALAPVVGVRPTSISVRDQQTRWGSASKAGSLSFSWRLLLAPPFVLDAVVVHELAHLRHANHGATFWALARLHAPRTDEARRWLRANRTELRSALD
ncbi:MAG: M48 family metallopeptidase [Chloroflexi bacterium]|nr:M48 family metallopeptidase [Chloroflexota bacterium]